MMTRHAWIALVLACSGNGGRRDGGEDAPWPEIDIVAPPDEICETPLDPSDACGGLGCYRRCDTCEEPCAAGTRCNLFGYCEPGSSTVYPERDNSGCRIPLTAENFDNDLTIGCASGRPCLGRIRDNGFFEGGSCIPAQTCVDARASDPPPFTCLYSDGTQVVTGPPEATCPPSDPRDPFCGGVCPWRACDQFLPSLLYFNGDCMGVSDRRGFGLCRITSYPCTAGEFQLGEDCAEQFGDECVCMVLPNTPGANANAGSLVLQDACRQYRQLYPEDVECMSRDWTPIPL